MEAKEVRNRLFIRQCMYSVHCYFQKIAKFDKYFTFEIAKILFLQVLQGFIKNNFWIVLNNKMFNVYAFFYIIYKKRVYVGKL